MHVLVSDVCYTYVIVMCQASCKLKLKGFWKTHPFFFAKFHSQPHSIISFTLLSKYKEFLPSLKEVISTEGKRPFVFQNILVLITGALSMKKKDKPTGKRHRLTDTQQKLSKTCRTAIQLLSSSLMLGKRWLENT